MNKIFKPYHNSRSDGSKHLLFHEINEYCMGFQRFWRCFEEQNYSFRMSVKSVQSSVLLFFRITFEFSDKDSVDKLMDFNGSDLVEEATR